MSKELSDIELNKLKEKATLLLANDRQKLVCRHPFIGNVAMKLDIVPIRDCRCRTACTTGDTIYFDIAFLSELSDSERLFVFGHEVWHNVMLHFARLQNRSLEIFNIATDMEVNQILEQDGFVSPKNVIFPSSYKLPNGKSAEEYYEMLLKKANKIKCSNTSDNSSGKLKGQFDKHTYDGHDNTLSDGEEEKEKENNDNEGNDKQLGDGSFKDKYGTVGFDKDFNPVIKSGTSEKIREAAISSAQIVERTQGNLPAHIQNVIDKLQKPELKWEELLAQFVTRCMNGEKRQWCPPNRRHIWHNTYLQSRRGEKLNIVVAVDTSGSCEEDLPKFFGEVISLVKSFGRYELKLLHIDMAVEHVDEFDDCSNPFPDDVRNIKWYGGGGTSFNPAFDYIEDNGIQPDCLIYFTDGYGDVNYELPNYPVLWILTKDSYQDFCNWGEKIKFKKETTNKS